MVFANFVNDVGEKPNGLSIDRIDNTLGYQPGNVRWASMREQSQNRRSTRLDAAKVRELRVRHADGESFVDLAKAYGVDAPVRGVRDPDPAREDPVSRRGFARLMGAARTLCAICDRSRMDHLLGHEDAAGHEFVTRRQLARMAKATDECPAHPGEFAAGADNAAPADRSHECLADEMRCAYCSERLAPYQCHGCGKFLSAKRMHQAATDGVWRCDECGG